MFEDVEASVCANLAAEVQVVGGGGEAVDDKVERATVDHCDFNVNTP
ncbi:hypothetical protein L4D76_07300 [Photobacterium sagamiensis]